MIRLLLADDEALIRDALASLLDLEDDVEVVARAASADEAVDAARVHRPDVALLDLQMPVRGRTDAPDGIDAATRILAADPRVATVVVTSHGRPGYLKRALEAGVRGFLPKTVPSRVLADVVRQVHAGGRYVDPELAAEAIATGGSPLTAREADVLELAAGQVLHAPAGMVVARQKYGVRDPEILSAIRKHTLGGADMTPFEALIYVSDVIEPNRAMYAGLSRARELAGIDLRAAARYCAQMTKDYVEKSGHGTLHPRTAEMLRS